MNIEHKTPCICNTCLRARDKELKAQKAEFIEELEGISFAKKDKPKYWDNWSIERQLGYNFALKDFKAKREDILKSLKENE